MYSWPFHNMGLNYAGPFIHGFFSINVLKKILEICDDLKKFGS